MTGDDRTAFLKFVRREKRWRMLASALRESGNPVSAEEQAVYRVANILGPSVLQTIKLNGQTAGSILLSDDVLDLEDSR